MAVENKELTQGLAQVKFKVESKKKVYTTLTDMFFRREKLTDQEHMEFDYKEYGILIPEEGIRGLDPKRINRGSKFEEGQIYGTYFNEEVNVDLTNLENRVWPELKEVKWTDYMRRIYILAEKRQEIMDGYKVAKEKMVLELLLNGEFVNRFGKQTFPVEEELIKLSGANLYTKPIDSIAAAVQSVIDAGGFVNKMIMNPGDAGRLAQSKAWLDLLDKRRVDVGQIDPQKVMPNGMAFIGTMKVTPAGPIEIWSYIGMQDDNEGNRTRIMPQGSAILCGDDELGVMGYTGILKATENGSVRIKAKEDYLVTSDKNGYLVNTKIMPQSAPCPILLGIDKYGVMTDIPATTT